MVKKSKNKKKKQSYNLSLNKNFTNTSLRHNDHSFENQNIWFQGIKNENDIKEEQIEKAYKLFMNPCSKSFYYFHLK